MATHVWLVRPKWPTGSDPLDDSLHLASFQLCRGGSLRLSTEGLRRPAGLSSTKPGAQPFTVQNPARSGEGPRSPPQPVRGQGEQVVREAKHLSGRGRKFVRGQGPAGGRCSCQALGSLRYSPQAQSKASWGVPIVSPLGSTESS